MTMFGFSNFGKNKFGTEGQEGHGKSRAGEGAYRDEKHLGGNKGGDLNMIEPDETLTGNYGGHGADSDFKYGVKPVMENESLGSKEEVVSDPELQMAELLEKKIEADLKGDSKEVSEEEREEAKKEAQRIEGMIVLHAKRNGLEYKSSSELN